MTDLDALRAERDELKGSVEDARTMFVTAMDERDEARAALATARAVAMEEAARVAEREISPFPGTDNGWVEAVARDIAAELRHKAPLPPGLVVLRAEDVATVREAMEPFADVGYDQTNAGCHVGICSAAECSRCQKVEAARAALKILGEK